MQSASQIVLIDSTANKTTLDKKATIAIGNQLKQGAGYRNLFQEQVALVDSLFLEIALREKENNTYKEIIVPTLKASNLEKNNENTLLRQKIDLKEQYHNAEIKHQKNKKWTWLGGGALIGLIIGVVFGG